MADSSALHRFIRSSFGSIWSLELLLVLRAQPEHRWTHEQLIRTLRASELVLSRSMADLVSAGLVDVQGQGSARYAPASPDLHETVAAVAELYASRPGTVRRLIVGAASDPIINFAEAFRFRKD